MGHLRLAGGRRGLGDAGLGEPAEPRARRLAQRGQDQHAVVADLRDRADRLHRRRGPALLLAVQVQGAQGRRARPDPRQHPPGDRLDRRRRDHPRRPRRLHVRPAAGHPQPAELRPRRLQGRLRPDRRLRPAPAAQRQEPEHLRHRPAVHLALHLRAELRPERLQVGLRVHDDVRADRHDGHARHLRAGRRPLVVDPAARRQVRRHPGLHEPHLVQDPGQAGRPRVHAASAPSCAGATTRT